MIIELALATNIPVREWWTESDAVIATALVVLEARNKTTPGGRK